MAKNDPPKKAGTKLATSVKPRAKLRASPAKSVLPKTPSVVKKAKSMAAKPISSKPMSAKPTSAKPTPAKMMNGHAGKTKQKADALPMKTPRPPALSKVTKPTSTTKQKIKKIKLVRDSFSMPELEYEGLSKVKKACIKAGFAIKKSELLRVGVALLQSIDILKLKA